jgi:DNA-binding response OmpR family regulator
VIMDLDLPGDLSGQEVAMMIHSNAATNRLPILIISGTHEGELERVRMRFPSIPILRKPFKFRDLVQYIDQCCSVP